MKATFRPDFGTGNLWDQLEFKKKHTFNWRVLMKLCQILEENDHQR